MIGEFIQINAFMKAIDELKGNCCREEKFRNGQVAIHKIWDEFVVSFKQLIEEQDTVDKLSIVIRIAQNNLTDFADKIYAVKLELQPCSETCDFTIRDVLKDISKVLIQTLLSLQLNYPEYFDNSTAVPLLVIRNNDENSQQHVRIVTEMQKKCIDPLLVQILDTHLYSLHVPGDNKIKCWRQFFYMKKLIEELLYFVELPDAPDDLMKLIRLLVGFNFNPLTLYDYIVDYISKEVTSDLPYEEQEMELILLLKTFITIRLEVKIGYNEEVPSIQESICHYITKELDTLSKMKEVMSPYTTNGEKGKNSIFYFEVNDSIEVLFFLMKVMTEVRFIKTKSKANLYTFVSRHIRTARTKNPSEQYMRNIFAPKREVPTRIMKQVRTWLTVMIAFIDNNYGDKLKIWFFTSMSYTSLYGLSDFCLS